MTPGHTKGEGDVRQTEEGSQHGVSTSRLLLGTPGGMWANLGAVSAEAQGPSGFCSVPCSERELSKLRRPEEAPQAGSAGAGRRSCWGDNSSTLGSEFECDSQHTWPSSFWRYGPF